eukprot:8982854-Ditylum_brightwellii.AAC.1
MQLAFAMIPMTKSKPCLSNAFAKTHLALLYDMLTVRCYSCSNLFTAMHSPCLLMHLLTVHSIAISDPTRQPHTLRMAHAPSPASWLCFNAL